MPTSRTGIAFGMRSIPFDANTAAAKNGPPATPIRDRRGLDIRHGGFESR
jgi:hypothetical protein